MKTDYLFILLMVILLSACQHKERFYVKQVVFPEQSTDEEKINMAAHVVPSESQYAWQRLELTAFVHFGINTFTGREWGNGKEDPALFNPVALDCGQWVKALQAGGFKMVILTAKHHDGFCLWPTATTAHSVASSPWRDGKGDVVAELKKACDQYGMKFGIYLSPWDRNAACYGDSPAYNKMFVEQLKELLSHYGKIDEVWFDGANAEGPNGKKQVYDWQAFYAVIDSLQPQAVKAIMGDDVRWVGNERGLGRETEWSVTPLTADIYTDAGAENERLGLQATSKDLGSREKVLAAKRLFWYPSEVDVSIRPGWFYHAEQDEQIKSLEQLADIYFRSVGYNSVLLLNVPPDRRGLIHENDVLRLKEFGEYLQQAFADNRIVAENPEMNSFSLKPGSKINTVMLGEDIRKGQRVEEFRVEIWHDRQWREVGRGTTIGYKRLLRFPLCVADSLRVTVTESRAKVYLDKTGAYYVPATKPASSRIQANCMPQDRWRVVAGTAGKHSQEMAVDSRTETYWESDFSVPLEIDMGRKVKVKGFIYTPVPGENIAGTVFLYQFYTSTDGKNWKLCECPGEFSNIMYNPEPQWVVFKESYLARYFRFIPLQEIEGRPWVRVGEIAVIN